MFCFDRCHFARVPVKEASVAANYRRPAPAFHVMAALPAPPAPVPVPEEAVEEPAGAVEAAPPPVVEPEVFFAFLSFQSAEPCEPLVSLPRVYVFSVRFFLYFRIFSVLLAACHVRVVNAWSFRFVSEEIPLFYSEKCWWQDMCIFLRLRSFAS